MARRYDWSAANSIATRRFPWTAAATACSWTCRATPWIGRCLDWIGCGDHDNGGDREYSWWITQKTTEILHLAGAFFCPMYTYERSCIIPDGHRNPVFAQRGVRTLPRLVDGSGTAMDGLPADAPRPHFRPTRRCSTVILLQFDGIRASHTSGTDMGTDWATAMPKLSRSWRSFRAAARTTRCPVARRSNTANDSMGGWRPLGFVSLR